MTTIDEIITWDLIGIGMLIGLFLFVVLLVLYLRVYIPKYAPIKLKNKIDLENLKNWIKKARKEGLSYEKIYDEWMDKNKSEDIKLKLLGKIKSLLGFKPIKKEIKLIKKAIKLAKMELGNYGKKEITLPEIQKGEDGRKIEEETRTGETRTEDRDTTETKGEDNGREDETDASGDTEPTEHGSLQKGIFSETRRTSKYFK